MDLVLLDVVPIFMDDESVPAVLFIDEELARLISDVVLINEDVGELPFEDFMRNDASRPLRCS